MRIFPTTRMFNPVNRGLAAIGRKWQELGARWTREWRNSSINSFRNQLDGINKSLVLTSVFLGVALLIPIIFGNIAFSVAGLFVAHWICVPMSVMGFVLQLGIVNYYLDTVHRDTFVFWDDTRVNRFYTFCGKVTFWMAVAYFVMVMFWISSFFWSTIFISPLLINMIALKLMVMDMYWFPVCIGMVFASWFRLYINKFRLFLLDEDIRRMQNQYDRNTDSMQEDITEDELIDYKLQRMGL
jgi:hypothetical protein